MIDIPWSNYDETTSEKISAKLYVAAKRCMKYELQFLDMIKKNTAADLDYQNINSLYDI